VKHWPPKAAHRIKRRRNRHALIGSLTVPLPCLASSGPVALGELLSIPFDRLELPIYVQPMVFARVQGSMEWCCPNCGHLNRSSLHYKNSWHIRCNGSDCRRAFAVGLTFYSMVGGYKSVPDDSIMNRFAYNRATTCPSR